LAFWRPGDSTRSAAKSNDIFICPAIDKAVTLMSVLFRRYTARPNPLKSDHCLSDVPVRGGEREGQHLAPGPPRRSRRLRRGHVARRKVPEHPRAA
jgi:hypothetical protein